MFLKLKNINKLKCEKFTDKWKTETMWKQKHTSTEVQKKIEERVTNLEFVYYMTLNIPDFCCYVKQTFNIIIFFSMAISITTSVRIYCFFQPIIRNSEFPSLCQPFRSISRSNIFYISIYKIPSFCNLITHWIKYEHKNKQFLRICFYVFQYMTI